LVGQAVGAGAEAGDAQGVLLDEDAVADGGDDGGVEGVGDQFAEVIRRHDELALSGVIQQIMSAENPEAELKFRRVNAVQRARAVAISLNVELDKPPAWLDSWD